MVIICQAMAERWMVCSACRKDIPFSSLYYACSVSTCNRAALRLVFCSVPCWDSHVADMRHRDAWAVEERSPAPSAGAAPRPVPSAAAAAPTSAPAGSAANADAFQRRAAAAPPAEESEVLVVVSKMKKYIRDRSSMSTADAVAERLSDHLRALCDAAIRNAATAGRKTVLDRDVPPLPSSRS